MREETGLELEGVKLAFVRTLRGVRQVEVIFRASMRAESLARLERSFEIDRAEWFAPAELPEGLSRDQRHVISRALAAGANPAE